jgi:hypothetical protein
MGTSHFFKHNESDSVADSSNIIRDGWLKRGPLTESNSNGTAARSVSVSLTNEISRRQSNDSTLMTQYNVFEVGIFVWLAGCGVFGLHL